MWATMRESEEIGRLGYIGYPPSKKEPAYGLQEKEQKERARDWGERLVVEMSAFQTDYFSSFEIFL